MVAHGWVLGVSVSRYSHSAKLMAEGQIAVFRLYRPDGAGVGPGLIDITAAMVKRKLILVSGRFNPNLARSYHITLWLF